MNIELKAVLQFGFDLVLTGFFVKGSLEKEVPVLRKIAGLMILALSVVLYIPTDGTQLFRLLVRFGVVLGALCVYRVRNLPWRIYMAALVTTLFMACQNVFFTPGLFEIYRGRFVFTGVPAADFIICLLIQWVVYTAIFLFVKRMVKPERTESLEAVEWLVLGVSLITEFYIKQALPSMNIPEGGKLPQITPFTVLLNLVMVAFIASFGMMMRDKKQMEEMRIQEALNQSYLKNLELHKQRDEEVRRLHHDMKNHLLALKSAAGKDNEKAAEYLEQLGSRLEPYESLVETGNELLNGILAQKQAQARAAGIDLEIQADCTGLGFIKDTDLCTIFGNALDNAIEACMKVEDPEDRIIRVKSMREAGQVLISVTNSYAGKVEMEHGLPRTTKKDKTMHGIGTRSIKRAAEKYGGTLILDPGKNKFTLTVVIPAGN